MGSLSRAISLATTVHSDQVDKEDMPYILHPLRVLARASLLTDDVTTLCAAVLHDVVEDGPRWTSTYILDEFGADVSDLVRVLTRTEDLSYDVYIKRILVWSDRARLIKLCDLADNLHSSRIGNISAERVTRYRVSQARLNKAFSGPAIT